MYGPVRTVVWADGRGNPASDPIGAEAFGQGPENNLLKPMIDSVANKLGEQYVNGSKITADSGFHCTESVEHRFEQGIDAYITDGNFRKRDPRLTDRDRYQPKARKTCWFKTADFIYDPETETCRCPVGNEMWSGGTAEQIQFTR